MPVYQHLRQTEQKFPQSQLIVVRLIIMAFTTILFIVTAWFAESTFSLTALQGLGAKLGRAFHVDVSSTLTILRFLEAILSLCVSVVLDKTFELLQWTLTSRSDGLRALQHLGLSPTTGFLGTIQLVFSKYSKRMDRAAASIRIVMSIAIWISGLLLFVKTQLHVVYEPVMSYNVTAGVGSFNGSYVPDYLQQYQTTNQGYGYTVLPLSTLISASTLVTSPLYSTFVEPVACGQGQVCHAYLVSGGLSMSTPWPPTNYTSSPVIVLKDIPVVQMDFVEGIHNDTFDDKKDCMSFGQEEYLIGMKFCLAKSQSAPGSLLAGIFVCQDGVVGNECWTDAKPPQLTTTFSVHNRHASITTSRVNLTVLSVDDVSNPVQELDLDVEALKAAFSWLFNYTAANAPGPTSIAQYFWTAQDQLQSDYWSVEYSQVFQSILAYPLFLFNPNGFGNTQLQAQDIITGLPEDFYTTAAIANPYEKIAVDRPMFVVFCILQSSALAFAWMVVIWSWLTRPRLPEISDYPCFDFATKTELIGVSEAALLSAVGNGAIRKALSSTKITTVCVEHTHPSQLVEGTKDDSGQSQIFSTRFE